VFGANNEAGLGAGQNASQGDNVLLYVPQTQVTATYFFSNVPGYTGWYSSTYTNAANTVIYPEQGIMVRRSRPGSVSAYWAGATKRGVTAVPVYRGFNLIGTLRSRNSVRLADMNLVTGDIASGLAVGSNLDVADNLIVLNASGTRTFFYSDYPGYTGWYDSLYAPAGDTLISPGSAFLVHRKAPRALFYWSIPAE
jgi:hypothetical protein